MSHKILVETNHTFRTTPPSVLQVNDCCKKSRTNFLFKFFIFYFLEYILLTTADGDEKYTIFGPVEIGTKVSC